MKSFLDFYKNNENVSEEIQSIEELNKDTVYSYKQKAEKDSDKQYSASTSAIKKDDPATANKASHKFQNRMRGIEKADDRLNKEETVAEAKESAAVRMQREIEKQRARSDASLQRTPSSIPKPEPKSPMKTEESELGEANTEYTHQVIHNKTGKVIGKYNSLKSARRVADKKDLEYGAVTHTVAEIRPMKEHIELDENTVDKEHPIVKEYDFLKKNHDIKSLRGLIKGQQRIVDTSEFKTKDHAISHYLRNKHGNKKVDQAFGFNKN